MENKMIKADDRFFIDHWWLKSYHLFSFAQYLDYKNMNFWNMRVFNDDYIKAETWFWLHPHKDMEILTIVIDWEITHWDNIWNKEGTKAWEIQTMTAWTWIMHSEENLWKEDVVLYQIWFIPNKNGLNPWYKNHKINLENNKLNLLASWQKEDNVWFLNSDVKVYRWLFSKWENIDYKIKKNRWLFGYITKWSLKIWDKTLNKWDQIRYEEVWDYDINIQENDTDFIVIDVNLNSY